MKLELKHVTKTFGNVVALNDFSMTFEAGVYGILGANGAGKSTMVHLITDNIKRDYGKKGGSILFFFEDILNMGSKFRSLVGYMPQQQGYYDDFSPKAFLTYIASIKGIKKKEAEKQIDELLSVVHLTEKAYDKIGGFSGGMKQRVLLAQALLGNPQILILDEPTAGLDPKERINIRNYISELSKNKIILFATHVVSDIECISDKVMLMKKGTLVTVGTPKELIEGMYGKVCEVICQKEEIPDMQRKFKVGAIRQKSDGFGLRIVGDNLPDTFKRVNEDIDLEDVYLYYFG